MGLDFKQLAQALRKGQAAPDPMEQQVSDAFDQNDNSDTTPSNPVDQIIETIFDDIKQQMQDETRKLGQFAESQNYPFDDAKAFTDIQKGLIFRLQQL